MENCESEYEQMSWQEIYMWHEALAIECIETAKAKVEEKMFGTAGNYLECVHKHVKAMEECIQVRYGGKA